MGPQDGREQSRPCLTFGQTNQQCLIRPWMFSAFRHCTLTVLLKISPRTWSPPGCLHPSTGWTTVPSWMPQNIVLSFSMWEDSTVSHAISLLLTTFSNFIFEAWSLDRILSSLFFSLPPIWVRIHLIQSNWEQNWIRLKKSNFSGTIWILKYAWTQTSKLIAVKTTRRPKAFSGSLRS